MNVAAGTAPVSTPDYVAVFRTIGSRSRLAFVIVAAALAYLTYAWFAFDVSRLIAKAQPDRAVLLGTDAVAHKVHVEKSLRTGKVEIAVEGERTARYQTPPEWVQMKGDLVRVDLGEGYDVEFTGSTVRFFVPGYGLIESRVSPKGGQTCCPRGRCPTG